MPPSSQVRPPPATNGAERAVAAPAAPALGAGTRNGQSGTNRGAWLHIAAFLDAFPHRPLENHARRIGAIEAQRTAEGAPPRGEVAVRVAPSAINFGGCVAPRTASVPDGNHGDNFPESAA